MYDSRLWYASVSCDPETQEADGDLDHNTGADTQCIFGGMRPGGSGCPCGFSWGCSCASLWSSAQREWETTMGLKSPVLREGKATACWQPVRPSAHHGLSRGGPAHSPAEGNPPGPVLTHRRPAQCPHPQKKPCTHEQSCPFSLPPSHGNY